MKHQPQCSIVSTIYIEIEKLPHDTNSHSGLKLHSRFETY